MFFWRPWKYFLPLLGIKTFDTTTALTRRYALWCLLEFSSITQIGFCSDHTTALIQVEKKNPKRFIWIMTQICKCHTNQIDWYHSSYVLTRQCFYSMRLENGIMGFFRIRKQWYMIVKWYDGKKLQLLLMSCLLIHSLTLRGINHHSAWYFWFYTRQQKESQEGMVKMGAR